MATLTQDLIQYIISAENRTGPGVRGAQQGFSGLEKTANRLKNTLIGLAGAISVGSLARLAKQGIDAADSLHELASKVGETTENISLLKFVADQSSTDLEQLTRSAFRLQDRMGKQGVAGAGTDFVSILAAVSKRLREVQDPLKQAAILTDAFGRSGMELREALTGDFDAIIAKAKELGLTLSGDAALAASEFNDRLGALSAQVERAKIEIGVGFIGALGDVEAKLLSPQFLASLHNIGELLGNMAKFFVEHGRSLVTLASILTGGAAGLKILKSPLGAVIGGVAGGLFARETEEERKEKKKREFMIIKERLAERDRLGKVTAEQQKFIDELGATRKSAGAKAAEAAAKAAEAEAKRAQKAAEAEAKRAQKVAEAAQMAAQSRLDQVLRSLDTETEAITRAAREQIAAIEGAEKLGIIAVQEAEAIKLKVRKETQDKVDGIYIKAIDAQTRVLQDNLDKLERLDEERRMLAENALEEQRERAKEQARIMQQPFLNALEGIQSAFTQGFEDILTGTVRSFSDFAQTIKRIFIRLVAEIAALLVFRPVLGGILSSMGQGALASSFGVGAGQLAAGGGFGAAINQFGARAGLTANASGFGGIFGGARGTQVLGAAGLSALGGGLIANTMGGSTGIGTGAGLGLGLAGFAVGGPIGALVGTIIGGIAGGLVKKTPPRGSAVARLGQGGGVDVFDTRGKKGFDPSGLGSELEKIGAATFAAGQSLGLDFRNRAFWLGFKEGEGFRARALSGAGDQSFQDIDQAALGAFRQITENQGKDPFQRRVLDRAVGAGGFEQAIASVQADVAFKKEFDRLVKESTPLANAIEDLNEQFEVAKVRARELALPIGELAKAKAKAVADLREAQHREVVQFARQFKTDGQLASQIEELNHQFEAMRGKAKEVGFSIAHLNRVQAKVAADMRKSQHREVVQFVRQFTSGGQLAAQIEELNLQFEIMRGRAKEVGFSIAELNKAQAKAVADLRKSQADLRRAQFEEVARFVGQFAGLFVNLGIELRGVNQQFAEMRDKAKEVGFSIAELNKAQTKAIRQTRLTVISGGLGRESQLVGELQSIRERLGITGIEEARKQIDFSPQFQSPASLLDMLQSELGGLRERSMAGDLDAVRAFPDVAQQLLSVAREFPGFADVFRSVNRDLNEVLGRQKAQFNIRDLDLTFRETSKLQVDVLRAQTKEIVTELKELRRELRRVRI